MRWSCILVFAACTLAGSQVPDVAPDRGQLAEPLLPTIHFSFEFAGSLPDHYAISVDRSGRAAYESRGRAFITEDPAPGDPYMVKFMMSDGLRDRIFALAEQANRFQGKFDYTKGRIANMGRKRLVYESGGDRFETTYNWSQHRAVQELTEIFRGISNTFEGARRLQYLRRHDKLGMDAELRRMEEQAKKGSLLEVHAIAALLRQLAEDPSVMHIARVRAEKLLRQAESEASAAAGGRG